MKNAYIKPVVNVVIMESQMMLSTSNELQMGGNYNGQTVGARRRGDFWDDEEE